MGKGRYGTMYNAKNKKLLINGSTMDYVTFGKGGRWLVLIAGLSLQGIKGKAQQMSYFYRQFGKEYKVLLFERKEKLPDNYTIRQMAQDIYQALCQLGVRKADIVGVSQGGMIAQVLTVGHPEIVSRLVLAVTLGRNTETSKSTMDKWISLAERNALYPLAYDSLDRAYSERYVRRHKIWLKMLAGLMSMLGRNADLPRFIIQAKAIENFNFTDKLRQITCPVLVIGAAGDKVLGVSGARALKEGIADAEYYEYRDFGHAAYIEAKDFNHRILEFLKK